MTRAAFDERRSVHEAGHATIGLGLGLPVTAVMLLEETPDVSGLCWIEADMRDVLTCAEAITYLLAGGLAAARAGYDRGDAVDRAVARQFLARRHWDRSTEDLDDLLRRYEPIVEAKIDERWAWLVRTAQRLRLRRVLTGDEVSALRGDED
jgi:hypothetical protein